MATNTEPLVHWVIYDTTTKDFPGLYVARQFEIFAGDVRPTATHMTAKDLSVLRKEMYTMGLTRLGRDPDDDPVILETWI